MKALQFIIGLILCTVMSVAQAQSTQSTFITNTSNDKMKSHSSTSFGYHSDVYNYGTIRTGNRKPSTPSNSYQSSQRTIIVSTRMLTNYKVQSHSPFGGYVTADEYLDNATSPVRRGISIPPVIVPDPEDQTPGDTIGAPLSDELPVLLLLMATYLLCLIYRKRLITHNS